MKYGQQLQQESVPEWSLHNLEYNALKHEIKAHTTRGPAAGMAIPGHPDPALRNFEDELYTELNRQHDRLHLFVSSKADEISRRQEHLNSRIVRWTRNCAGSLDSSISLKRQRRVAKYERELLRCGQDIFSLSRFAKAQVVAFRKILKKYRKWTGSSALTSRFSEAILGNPKSFTKRDFGPLEARYHDILSNLRASAPDLSKPSSPSSAELSQPEPPSPGKSFPERRWLPDEEPRIKYWNEYDDGSDSGGPEDEYAIYVDPENEADFPGLAYVRAITTRPYEKAKQWFERRKSGDETRPLLSSADSAVDYSSPAIDSEEEGYSSYDAMPHQGYATYRALPSLTEQKVARYREKMLLRGTIGCFLTSFILLAIAGMLIWTGKRKLRVEVDAGVTLGVMVSLLCSCIGLGMTLYRRDSLKMMHRLLVWGAFSTSCLMNGVLLVLVLGSAS